MLGVRAEVACVSENHARHMSFVFHYWWDGLFVPAATWCFAFSFVGFALTAIVAFVLADNVTGQLHRL